MGVGASEEDAGPIERTGLVVFEPLLEALFVEDVPALLDGAEAAVLGELGEADGALHVEHVVLEVEAVDEGVVPAGGGTVPVGHALGDEDEHAGEGEAHDGVHVDQVVDVAVGGLQLVHLLIVLVQQQLLVLGLVVRDGLTHEDGHEDGEKDEEGRQHLVVELLKLQQHPNCHSQEDVDVEEELKLDDVQLLKVLPVLEDQRVQLVSAKQQDSVDSQDDQKFDQHQYYILPKIQTPLPHVTGKATSSKIEHPKKNTPKNAYQLINTPVLKRQMIGKFAGTGLPPVSSRNHSLWQLSWWLW